MRTALYFGLVLLLLLSLQPHSLAVRLPGVAYTYSVAPDGGDKANALTNGVTGDSVGWSNGDGKPLNVAATFRLPGGTALDHIKVFSTGINVWWWVPHIKVTGHAPGAKGWQILLDRDWYERKPNVPGEPQDVRTFDITIPAESRRYDEVRVEISRPSIWVLLPLSEVEFHISDAVEAAIGTNWTAYTVGQTCNGTLRLDSSMKTSMNGAKVSVEVINAGSKKNVGACFEQKVDLPNGIKEISFTYPTKTAGRFYLRARLDGPVIVTAEQSGDAAPVKVKIINHLAENAAGTIQLRIDGIANPASEAIPFKLTSGQQGSYKLPVKKLDRKLLVDNRGMKRSWYVWVIYDGTARSFARVHPTGDLMAP